MVWFGDVFPLLTVEAQSEQRLRRNESTQAIRFHGFYRTGRHHRISQQRAET